MTEAATMQSMAWVDGASIKKSLAPLIEFELAEEARSELLKAHREYLDAMKTKYSFEIALWDPYGVKYNPWRHELPTEKARAKRIIKLADAAIGGKLLMSTDDLEFCARDWEGCIASAKSSVENDTDIIKRSLEIIQNNKPDVGHRSVLEAMEKAIRTSTINNKEPTPQQLGEDEDTKSLVLFGGVVFLAIIAVFAALTAGW